jgi:2-haloacid dehalogenase
VIHADEIDTLLFDILGTVVDEAGSMRAELGDALGRAGAAGRTGALAADWEWRFAALVAAIGEGAPWRSTDDLNAGALADALRDGPRLPEATVRDLGLAGHRLRPWPDAQDALRRLAQRFAVVALSNGNLSMLTDLFAAGGLTWHCVLSGEMVHAYKPDPAVYRLALDRLALNPRRTLMIAAHPWDLRAAAAHGLRTVYIERAGEGAPDPSDTFDLSVPDLAALASRLLANPLAGATAPPPPAPAGRRGRGRRAGRSAGGC